MDIDFDAKKNQQNIETRGLDFELVRGFDFDKALEVEQMIDGEIRYFALGHIGDRLYALVYTLRGETVRVISLRKANMREVKRYDET